MDAPAIARKRSARFASMVVKCKEIVRDVIDDIVDGDVCWQSPSWTISGFILEKIRFDCSWPSGIRLLLAIFP